MRPYKSTQGTFRPDLLGIWTKTVKSNNHVTTTFVSFFTFDILYIIYSMHDFISVHLEYAILVKFHFWTKTTQLNNFTVDQKCYSIT